MNPAVGGVSLGGSAMVRLWLAVTLLAVGVVSAGGAWGAEADDEVVVVEINGAIDLGLAPYLDRVLADAAERDVAAVIVELDTPGGRLDAVLQMRDSLLGSPVRTVAFVDRTAFSAGALIALASHEIWMTPGAVMGAATPVVGATGETASEKVVSAVRSTFRSTAEQRGRDPAIGEAMVDPAVSVDGVVDEGELLTLTSDEARSVGYSDGTVADRDALLDELDLADTTVRQAPLSPAERLVRVVTSPVIASTMVSIGVLLIVGELLLGGLGAASALGFALLGAFSYGHLLAGLAGWEDVALIALGVVLILIEVFVIPGFGVVGSLGVIAALGGGTLAMLGRDFEFVSGPEVVSTVTTTAVTFLIGLLVIGALVVVLARRRGHAARPGWARWLGDGGVLARDADAGAAGEPGGPTPRVADVGEVGTALSDLRPAGVAEFDGRRVDVVTDGGYLEAGTRVEVLRAEAYRRVVRRSSP